MASNFCTIGISYDYSRAKEMSPDMGQLMLQALSGNTETCTPS